MDALDWGWLIANACLWVAAGVCIIHERAVHDRETRTLVAQNTRLTELLAAVKTPWAAEVVQSLQAQQHRDDDNGEEPDEILA